MPVAIGREREPECGPSALELDGLLAPDPLVAGGRGLWLLDDAGVGSAAPDCWEGVAVNGGGGGRERGGGGNAGDSVVRKYLRLVHRGWCCRGDPLLCLCIALVSDMEEG